MRKVTLILISGLFIQTQAHAVVARAQTSDAAKKSCASVATCAATAITVTAGSVILCDCSDFTSGMAPAISGCTDTLSNTYTKVTDLGTGSADRNHEVWHAKNVSGGSTTTSCNTASSSTTIQVAVTEVTGASKTNPIGAIGVTQSGTSTTASCAAVTPTNSSSLIYGFTHVFANATITPSHTQITEKETFLVDAAQFTVAPGATTLTWTIGTSQTWKARQFQVLPDQSTIDASLIDAATLN